MADRPDPLADLRRANAELVAARKAALNMMEDAILARDAVRASETRKAFLLKLSDALRPVADAAEVLTVAAHVLGEHLEVNRAFYAEVEGDNWIGATGYEQGVTPLPDGSYSADTFGHWIMQTYRDGGRIVFRDTQNDPRFAVGEREAYAAAGIGGVIGVPLVKEGRLVAILAVHTVSPRDWTDAEIGLVEETAERTWAAVERATAEAAVAEEFRNTKILQDLSTRLITEESTQTIYEAILTAAINITRADAGTLQMIDDEATELVVLATRGFSRTTEDYFRRVNASSVTSCGLALRTGERAFLDFDPANTDRPIRLHVEDGLLSAQSSPLISRTGKPIGMVSTHWRESGRRPSERELRFLDLLARQAADVIERQQVEHALRASEEKYRTLFNSVDTGFCIIEVLFNGDRPVDYRFLEANPAFETQTGLTGAVGRTIREMVPDQDAHWFTTYGEIVRTGEARRFEMPAEALGRFYDVYAFRVGDPGEQRLAVLFNDILPRKTAETTQRASEERLRLALAVGGLGTWDWKVLTGHVVWNDDNYLMQGYAVGEVPPSYEAWLTRIHPDDRAGAEAAINTARDTRTLYSHDYRSLHANGSVHWLSARGSFFYDEAGTAFRMVGVMRDATEQRQAEESVRRSEERLRLALSAARMGTWSLDPATGSHTRDANLNALLGLPAVEGSHPFDDFLSHIHPDDQESVRTTFDQSVRQGCPLNIEFRVVWPDGTVRWLRDQGDVFSTVGQLRLAGACVDVTDLKETEAALQMANDRLEDRVTERTAELATAVDALEKEMVQRRDLARRLTTAQEDERRRVARDLHDTLGQLQAGLGLAVSAARRVVGLPVPAAESLANVQRIADELMRETHALAVRLRPTVLDDLGLDPAIRQLVSDWFTHIGVAIDFQTVGLSGERLPAEVETAIYRMVQEALTNIARHANADQVSVAVTATDGRVTAVVEDNGVGFDPSAGGGRLGLVGMRERVELAGGTLEIESVGGTGATIMARFPLVGATHDQD